MESLDLNTLAKSLPNGHLASAEKDLLNDFKAAALSITTLYRSSRETSKTAYNAGYAAALDDVLGVVHTAISESDGTTNVNGEGMGMARIIDWTEARLEAVRAREEEEDEDEDKDNRGAPAGKGAAPPHASAGTPATGGKSPVIRPKDLVQRSSPTLPPSSPQVPARRPPSPSTSTSTPASSSRPLKRSYPFPSSTGNSSDTSFDSTLSADSPAAGAKRRHAVMMQLNQYAPQLSTVSIDPMSPMPLGSSATANMTMNMHGGPVAPGGGRRRTRSSRGGRRDRDRDRERAESGGHVAEEEMDVEEEGRERKRVARR